MTGAPPKVFISYSHGTVEHQMCWALPIGCGPMASMPRSISTTSRRRRAGHSGASGDAADVVLMICTETYNRRVKGDEERGKGLGVVWEARIIRQLIYDAGSISEKFVPVLFSDTSPEQIPTPIKSGTRYVVDTEDG